MTVPFVADLIIDGMKYKQRTFNPVYGLLYSSISFKGIAKVKSGLQNYLYLFVSLHLLLIRTTS